MFCAASHGDDIRLAVATNFAAPMKHIALAFEQESSHKLRISYGSSGKLFAQIQHGAPFHLFLSADQVKPQRIEALGLGVQGTRRTYAIGALSLWSINDDNRLHPKARLMADQYQRLALANPKLAPYGEAAQAVLNALNVAQASRSKWVVGENIAQAFQFVHSGNAQLGFIARSQVSEIKNIGQVWHVPPELHGPIKQDLIVLKQAASLTGVQELLNFLQSDTVALILKEYGYTTL